jgi:hypothetical protein
MLLDVRHLKLPLSRALHEFTRDAYHTPYGHSMKPSLASTCAREASMVPATGNSRQIIGSRRPFQYAGTYSASCFNCDGISDRAL